MAHYEKETAGRLNIEEKWKTINILEENIENYIHDLGVEEAFTFLFLFFCKTHKAQTMKNIGPLEYSK